MTKKKDEEEKCSNCGSIKTETFWEYDDGSLLCDKCENKISDNWAKVHNQKHMQMPTGTAIYLLLSMFGVIMAIGQSMGFEEHILLGLIFSIYAFCSYLIIGFGILVGKQWTPKIYLVLNGISIIGLVFLGLIFNNFLANLFSFVLLLVGIGFWYWVAFYKKEDWFSN